MRDTLGRIPGYISSDKMLDHIKKTYDQDARSTVKHAVQCSLSKFNGSYKKNPGHEQDENLEAEFGFIYFKYGALFYLYENVTFDNEYDQEYTHISMTVSDCSVYAISKILADFGGGWIDENDEDFDGFIYINPSDNINEETEETNQYDLIKDYSTASLTFKIGDCINFKELMRDEYSEEIERLETELGYLQGCLIDAKQAVENLQIEIGDIENHINAIKELRKVA